MSYQVLIVLDPRVMSLKQMQRVLATIRIPEVRVKKRTDPAAYMRKWRAQKKGHRAARLKETKQ